MKVRDKMDKVGSATLESKGMMMNVEHGLGRET
jgi:hypothetical protein